MYKGNTIGVVVPAYNEAGHVGAVIDTVPPYADRVYVIDDCSTDETWQEIQRAARAVNGEAIRERSHDEPRSTGRHGATTEVPGVPRSLVEDGGITQRVVPIRHERNRGVGGAIKTGYRRARADGIDVTAVMAGDGQMDPTLLHRILDPVVGSEVSYAKGTRLLSKEYRAGMPAWRVFGNTLLTYLTKIASGYWGMTDPQNGYTAISLDVFDDVDLDSLYEDYGFLNDLLVRLNAQEVSITDVPLPARYGSERSNIRYSRFVPNLSMLLLRDFVWRLRVKYVDRGFHPVVLFYLFGSVGVTVGGLLLGASFIGSTFDAIESAVAGWLLAGGLLFLLTALAVDRQLNRGLVSSGELLSVER